MSKALITWCSGVGVGSALGGGAVTHPDKSRQKSSTITREVILKLLIIALRLSKISYILERLVSVREIRAVVIRRGLVFLHKTFFHTEIF